MLSESHNKQRFFEMMKNNIESLKGAKVGKWTTQRMTSLVKSFSDWSRDLNNIVIATQNKIQNSKPYHPYNYSKQVNKYI